MRSHIFALNRPLLKSKSPVLLQSQLWRFGQGRESPCRCTSGSGGIALGLTEGQIVHAPDVVATTSETEAVTPGLDFARAAVAELSLDEPAVRVRVVVYAEQAVNTVAGRQFG